MLHACFLQLVSSNFQNIMAFPVYCRQRINLMIPLNFGDIINRTNTINVI